MNVLFVTSRAPKISPHFTFEKRPPLGLGTLISVVRNAGHNVFFIDNFLKPSNFIEEGFLKKNQIDFIAISANTVCFRDTLRMFNAVEKLRRRGLSKVKIIVGGPHTSVALDTIPDFVDYIVQGEGEEVILDIIEGRVQERVIRKPRIKNLDSLPFQPWDIFTKLPYDHYGPWIDVDPVFTMNTSRGCPLDCTFCSVSAIWGKQYTSYSADRIIAEIEYLIEHYGAKGIFFREDNFTLDYNRTAEFCRKMINKQINIPWICETRVDTLCDEELVKLMSAAGCKAVYLGIESGSQRILDKLAKNITLAQIEEAITLCKKYDINTYCSFIFGLPDETYEDYLLTKGLIGKLRPHAYRFHIFVWVPGSPLYKYTRENKIYEYIDDLGILYMPGFDVKTKFFYRMNSRRFVNHKFKQRTDYDKKLLRELRLDEFYGIMNKIDRLFSIFPNSLEKNLRKIKQKVKSVLFKISFK